MPLVALVHLWRVQPEDRLAASGTSQTIDATALFDLWLKDRRQQNDYYLMIGVSIRCRYYFSVDHDSDVYDDPSLFHSHELGSMDLFCRGGLTFDYS